MKPNHSNHDLPDFDADLEQDAVWNLLGESTPADPSPRFVQDTLRKVRLDEAAPEKAVWWKSLLFSKPLIGITGAALAAVAVFVSLPTTQDSPETITNTTPEVIDDWQSDLHDAVAVELLSSAAEDPTLFTDEEIVALLY